MTSENKHVTEPSGAYRDLYLALRTATSTQETIRHADTKAQVLLGLHGGIALAVLQQLSTLTLAAIEAPALLAVAMAAASGWLIGLAVSGAYLLSAIAPRSAPRRGNNRFAIPADRPTDDDVHTQRVEAWDLVSTLAAIASVKHERVRRSLPALIASSAFAGALVALSIAVGTNP